MLGLRLLKSPFSPSKATVPGVGGLLRPGGAPQAPLAKAAVAAKDYTTPAKPMPPGGQQPAAALGQVARAQDVAAPALAAANAASPLAGARSAATQVVS